MWIRSKDGKNLVNCNWVALNDSKKIYGDFDGVSEGFVLGQYSTEERATEVLGEIQQFVVDVFQCQTDTQFYPVYQMPKE